MLFSIVVMLLLFILLFFIGLLEVQVFNSSTGLTVRTNIKLRDIYSFKGPEVFEVKPLFDTFTNTQLPELVIAGDIYFI